MTPVSTAVDEAEGGHSTTKTVTQKSSPYKWKNLVLGIRLEEDIWKCSLLLSPCFRKYETSGHKQKGVCQKLKENLSGEKVPS